MGSHIRPSWDNTFYLPSRACIVPSNPILARSQKELSGQALNQEQQEISKALEVVRLLWACNAHPFNFVRKMFARGSIFW